MESPNNRVESHGDGVQAPGSGKGDRLPRAATRIDTAIAVLFCGTGIYHFTQPNQAWRSGAIEVACALALLVAAHLLSRTMSILLHVAVALGIGALGIRHLVLGGGWRSGTMELLMAVVILGVAAFVFRHKPAKR
jgi:hypothetical protein